MSRKLDRERDYAYCSPAHGDKFFMQDGLYFDHAGNLAVGQNERDAVKPVASVAADVPMVDLVAVYARERPSSQYSTSALSNLVGMNLLDEQAAKAWDLYQQWLERDDLRWPRLAALSKALGGDPKMKQGEVIAFLSAIGGDSA